MSLNKLIRDASYLLPDPGGEVVRELLDKIEELEKELAKERDGGSAHQARHWCKKYNDLGAKIVECLEKMETEYLATSDLVETKIWDAAKTMVENLEK